MDRTSSTARTTSRAAALLAGVALACATAGPSHAAPPDRAPLELPPTFLLTDTAGVHPCGFPVTLEVITNKETQTTFTRRDGTTSVHITGALEVRLVTEDRTITRNISGPIIMSPQTDGTTPQVGLGRALWVFDEGVATDLPRLAVLSGRSQYVSGATPADFRWNDFTGRAEDLCAVLAG